MSRPTPSPRGVVSRSHRARLCAAALVTVALSSTPGLAAAQPAQPAQPAAPPQPAPKLVPPKISSDGGAVYPQKAIDDKVKDAVTVVLVLEIDAQGVVTNATVETPMGHGFDEAAVDAAKKITFEPATRDGKPIPSRIKHKYEFTPPSARAVGRIVDATNGKPLAGAKVTATDASTGATFTAATGDDGAFTIDKLPAGTYHFTIEAEGRVAQSYDDTLEPAQEASSTIRMAKISLDLPPPKPGEPAPPDVIDIEVKGERPPREVTKRTLDQRELSRIPGTNGDALRAIQNLPGVARAPGLAGLLIVRGSAPNQTNIFVDGTLIPIAYHFGGLSSVIPTEMLEKIDFFPGNFSSYYGRVIGGIVDIGVKDSATTKEKPIRALAQADLIDARMLFEAPIADTGWKLTLAGRRSYVDTWLKPVLEQTGAGVTTAPVYYDYQAMLQRDFGKKQSLRFFVFGSDDRLDLLVRSVNGSNPGLGGNVSLGTAFYRFQARYTNKLSDDVEFRMVAAAGKDAIQFSLGEIFFNLSSWPITLRTELTHKLASGVRNNVGMDILYSPYDVSVRAPPPPRPGEPPPGPFGSRPPLTATDTDSLYRPALYDEVELTPFRSTRIVPGARLDYAKDTRTWDLQPRVIVRQDLHSAYPRTTLKGGAGRFTQPPQPQETNSVFGLPNLVSNRATHYGLGVEQELTKNVEISMEGFYRQLDRLVVQRQGNTGKGRAFGIETLLRYKPDSRFFGFLAYTLSRSVLQDTPDEPERLFNFDQTHILTVLGSYRLGRGWELGARFRLVSGNLNTPQSYGFYDATVGAYSPLQSFPPFGFRNPAFHQLDVRVDKTWIFKGGSKFSMYLDILNIYNHGNVEGVGYNYNQTQRSFATGLPILPSFGLRAEL